MTHRFVLRLWLLLVLIAAPQLAHAVDPNDFSDFSLRSATNQVLLPGRLYTPPEAASDPNTPRPLIVYLHGGGGNGTNNLTQLAVLPDGIIDEAKRRGAYLYVPQAPNGWNSSITTGRAMSMVDSLVTDRNADNRRLYVTGHSNGGGGTWNMLSRYPGRFAAGMPLSGVLQGGDFVPKNLIHTPVLAVHSRDDDAVSFTISFSVVNKILLADRQPLMPFPGSSADSQFLVYNPNLDTHQELATFVHAFDVTQDFLLSDPNLDLFYFELPEGGHGGSLGAYFSPVIYDWLFSHTVPEPTTIALAGTGLICLTRFNRRRSPYAGTSPRISGGAPI